MDSLRTTCNYCKKDLADTPELFSLGTLYKSDFLKERNGDLPKSPLSLVMCDSCYLVQLKYKLAPEEMFYNYYYSSKLNKTMVRELENIAAWIQRPGLERPPLDLGPEDAILDIGCNDGTFLNSFYIPYGNLRKVGIDPGKTITPADPEIKFVNTFFSKAALEPYGLAKKGGYKLISAIAMFYDVPDISQFLADVEYLLHKDGYFILQFTGLKHVVNDAAFDSICHEHISYYTLEWLRFHLSQHGLAIVEAQENQVNGGSWRVAVAKGRETPEHVIEFIEQSGDPTLVDDIENPAFWEDYRLKITYYKKIVTEFIRSATAAGFKVYGLGASTKGNTLLQYFNLTEKDIVAIGEIHNDKIGLFTPTNIPIIDEKRAIDSADLLLVLPWHYAEFFRTLPVIETFLLRGGVMLLPLPLPKLIVKTRDKGDDADLLWYLDVEKDVKRAIDNSASLKAERPTLSRPVLRTFPNDTQ